MWAVLRTLGRQGVTDLITRTCRHAQAMAAYLSQAGLEVLNDVVLNQVLVRAATDDQTRALIAAVQQDGTCWCGPTVWQHRPAMRISVSRLGDNRRGHQAKRRRHHRRCSAPGRRRQIRTRPVIHRYVTMLGWTHTRQRSGRVVRRG